MKLIDKDAVLAMIEQLKDEAIDMEDKARWFLSAALARRIEAIEVKEVDLEKEIREEYLKRRCYGGRDNMFVILNEPQFNMIAKYFFELGMAVSNKAQKGEEV